MFKNRLSAAKDLARALLKYQNGHPLVLAIPRGAVPMGEIIARELGAELDVVLVKKIADPWNSEFAIGAVTESGTVIANPSALEMGYTQDFLDRAAKSVQEKLIALRQLYTEARPKTNTKNRTVIIVDDGVATGSTILAAIAAIRETGPRKIIVAIAVAPPDTVARLRREADEVVVLKTPEVFLAISHFFDEFSQVTDDEVTRVLSRAHREYSRRFGAESPLAEFP